MNTRLKVKKNKYFLKDNIEILLRRGGRVVEGARLESV